MLKCVLLAIIWIALVSPLHADMAEIDDIHKKLKVCCNEFDGRPPDDLIWDADGKHYRVKLLGQWVEVPDDKVLDIPNKWGVAVVWYSVTSRSGTVEKIFNIRCFLPGALL